MHLLYFLRMSTDAGYVIHMMMHANASAHNYHDGNYHDRRYV